MTEKTQMQVLKIDLNSIPEYQGAKEKQETLVKENPYVEIEDSTTYELGKKRRTAFRQGRYELQNGEKAIAAQIAKFRGFVKSETEKLINITLPHEEKQQTEVERYEAIKQAEKEERERIERERIEKNRNLIIEFRQLSQANINKADLSNIDEVEHEIINANLELEEEFVPDLQLVKDQLILQVASKREQLDEAESVRVEKERLAAEQKKIDAEKKEREKKDNRMSKMFELGLRYDGQSFTYKDINFHWSDLICMTDEEFENAVAGARKRLSDIKKDEASIAERKKQAGKARAEMLSEIGIKLDENTCADMEETVWNEYYESSNKAYQAEQNRIHLDKMREKKEHEDKTQKLREMAIREGHIYTYCTLRGTSFEAASILTNEQLTAEIKRINDAKEKARLDALKSDKEKALEVVKSLSIQYAPEIKIQDKGLDDILADFIGKTDQLMKEFITIIEIY